MQPNSRRVIALLALFGLALVALTFLGLLLQARDARNLFLALAVVQGAVYLGAVVVLRSVPASRAAVICVLAVAALLRVLPLSAPPYLSDDIYRYVWDGRVQAAGINPYRYVPADPALADLRDAAIYPNINRKDYARTIYPPAAQMIFLAVEHIGGSIGTMRLAMVALEAAALLLLLALLRQSGLPATRLLIYAWNPLTVWEFAGSGHVDAACIALFALALLLRRNAHQGWAGAALAAACLVKPFPVAVAPALYRPWGWRFPVGFVVAAGLAYLPYLDVGARVLGFLPGYVREEGLVAGSGFYPLLLLRYMLPFGVPTEAYVAGALLFLLGLALWVTLRADPEKPVASAILLALAFVFLVSPHYPSYLAWLLVFGVIEPYLPLLYVTAVSFVLYLPFDLAITGSVVYGGMVLLALLHRFRPAVTLSATEVSHAADYPG